VLLMAHWLTGRGTSCLAAAIAAAMPHITQLQKRDRAVTALKLSAFSL
jgi:hypothetical protein